MKMVKSLLLGSAAGLVAVTAGQAADLPVKAKPVEYVKICSLYGAGFYYMPGTDLCLKIGGFVRAEATWGDNGNSTSGIFNNDVNNRTTNNFWSRYRGYITADAREMTEYGVARGYIAVGVSSQNTGGEANSGQFSANRAFVQWAGMTAGQTVSFFDFYPAAALLIRAGNIPSEDTGDGGWWVWAYTAQLGGGFSATLSAEERRMSQIVAFSGAAGGALLGGAGVFPSGTFASGLGYGGWQAPDVVANVRVDQAWGSAQLMGALHELNPLYYTATTTVADGHAPDRWGWVVGAGLRINAPSVSAGDYFIGEVNYTQGATRYLWHGESAENQLNELGAREAFGVGSDCVYGGAVAAGNTTTCQLTTAWGVNAAYEHYWTPQWHESFVFAYMQEQYNAQANNMLCLGEGLGAVGGGAGAFAVAAPGCNNNWSVWGAGSRLQWDVTKSFYLGVEALYEHIQSATTPTGFLPGAVVVAGSGAAIVGNTDNWEFTARMHKDFLP
jgi:hypothetical protein